LIDLLFNVVESFVLSVAHKISGSMLTLLPWSMATAGQLEFPCDGFSAKHLKKREAFGFGVSLICKEKRL
jgi:hypothetical protein